MGMGDDWLLWMVACTCFMRSRKYFFHTVDELPSSRKFIETNNMRVIRFAKKKMIQLQFKKKRILACRYRILFWIIGFASGAKTAGGSLKLDDFLGRHCAVHGLKNGDSVGCAVSIFVNGHFAKTGIIGAGCFKISF